MCIAGKYEEQKKQIEQLQQTRDQVRVSALAHVGCVYVRICIAWAVHMYIIALHIHTHTVCTCAAITVEFAHTSTHSPSAMPLQALADFESMEKAFSDLHTRYFKLKELTQALKKVGGLMCCPQRLLLIL